MDFEIGTVKGFHDYLPPASLKRERILEIAKKYFKLYGFLPIETPLIEFEALAKSNSMNNVNPNDLDEAVAERFRLKDRKGRNLCLRYEFTFQLARIFKENQNIKLPFKRYQIGPVFRDEPIRKGRTRQFTQCDADIIGNSSVKADAECLSLVSDILKELNIKHEILINNRKLLNALIESVEIKATKQVLRELDKLEKLGEDEIKSNLRKYAGTNQIVTLFKLFEKNLDFLKESNFEGIDELEELIKISSYYGLKLRFIPSMVRGFEYYTGNVFEIMAGNKKTAIAGGGRYDKSIGKFTRKEIPAVGISFSLEALTELCSEEFEKLKIDKYPKVIIISINQDKEAIKLSKKLRKKSVPLTISYGKPSKALDYANSLEIRYAIFIGDEEIKSKKLKLKDLKTGTERLLTEKRLIDKLA